MGDVRVWDLGAARLPRLSAADSESHGGCHGSEAGGAPLCPPDLKERCNFAASHLAPPLCCCTLTLSVSEIPPICVGDDNLDNYPISVLEEEE